MGHNTEQLNHESKPGNPMRTGRWWVSLVGLVVLGLVVRNWIFPVFEEDVPTGIALSVGAVVAHVLGVLVLTWLIDGFREERFPPSSRER